jgi:hypothetical protein
MRGPASFITGIVIGLAASAALFFVFKISGGNGSSSSNDLHTSADTLIDKRVPEKNARTKRTALRNNSNFNAAEIDADETTSADTSLADTAAMVTDEVIVRRDEMIKSVSIEFSAKATHSDSLISIFLEESSTGRASVNLEFWRSPVNFRGFKFIRNTVVAFGLDAEEPATAALYNGELYVKNGSNVYRMYPTARFKPLQLITDGALLKSVKL